MAETQQDIAQYQSDHDVLIEVRTEMRGMRGDIKEMKDDTVIRLVALERDVTSLKIWRGGLIALWGILTLIIIPLAAAVISTFHL